MDTSTILERRSGFGLVLAGDVDQELVHGEFGGCAKPVLAVRQQDASCRYVGAEGEDADVRVRVTHRGPRRERDSESDADHGLRLLVVVGLERDLRGEPGRAAAAFENLGRRMVVGGEVGVIANTTQNFRQ